jgi:Zn-dependent peptidase ImmA (M78 family)
VGGLIIVRVATGAEETGTNGIGDFAPARQDLEVAVLGMKARRCLGTSDNALAARHHEAVPALLPRARRAVSDSSNSSSPEALANGIIEHYGPALAIPVPVQNIAEAVGISEITPMTTSDFEGLLITDANKTKGTIAYNANSIIERRRFTIAHEIGHFLLPFHGVKAQCAKGDLGIIRSADERRAREAEANRLAAALLLPEKQFRADIRRLGKPETAHILKLAARYQTSKEATARRYTELSDDPCAIVFSRDGQVRSYCKSNGFPRITAVQKKSLPMGSLSLKTASRQLPSGTLSDWAEVDASVWLENGNQARSKTLCEQYLQQANGYRLTMLTFDPIDDDEVDEQDDLEGRWAILFRK